MTFFHRCFSCQAVFPDQTELATHLLSHSTNAVFPEGEPKAEVKLFTGVTCLDLPADRVMDAVPRDLTDVIILGYTAEGGEYFASSYAGGGDVLWLMERLKLQLLTIEVPKR